MLAGHLAQEIAQIIVYGREAHDPVAGGRVCLQGARRRTGSVERFQNRLPSSSRSATAEMNPRLLVHGAPKNLEPRCRRYAEQITHAGGHSLSQSGALTSRKPLTFKESERRLTPGAQRGCSFRNVTAAIFSALLVDDAPAGKEPGALDQLTHRGQRAIVSNEVS